MGVVKAGEPEKVAEAVAEIFSPKALIRHYSYYPVVPKEYSRMLEKFERKEELPEKWREFFEFVRERGHEQVPFSEYPEILKEWILDGIEDTLGETNTEGVGWIDDGEEGIAVIKQRDGGYALVHLEPVSDHPSPDECKRILFNQLLPIQEALRNAVPEAFLDEGLFSLHEGLFNYLSSKQIVGTGKEENFVRFHRTVYSYGTKYPVGDEEVNRIRELLEEFPEVSFDGEWKVKTETEASLLREKLQESSLEGEVSLEGPESCLEDDGLSP